jgi:hypothetical protein
VKQTFSVDWGDGHACAYSGSGKLLLLSHDYPSEETFEVTIRGVITAIVTKYTVSNFGISVCDVRGNPYLEATDCDGKLLLQNNHALRELNRFAIGIKEIDLTGLPALECINLMDSLHAGPLDFSHNPKLKYLSCPCNRGISALDVSRCPDLEYIDICYATCPLHLEHNHKLKYVFANGVDKQNIYLPEGKTVITDHDYDIPEKYWTLWDD